MLITFLYSTELKLDKNTASSCVSLSLSQATNGRHHKGWRSTCIRNIGTFLTNCTTSHLKRRFLQRSSYFSLNPNVKATHSIASFFLFWNLITFKERKIRNYGQY